MENLLLVVPGGTFGCEDHFRIAYCVSDRTIEQAIKRLPPAMSQTELHTERKGV
jgi:aspartate/methionine/tyrosine aminotransferase